MESKKIMVSFLAVISILVLAAIVSADQIANKSDVKVEIEGVETNALSYSDNIAVVAGDTITIKVYFTATEKDSDVRVKAELEGDKVDVEASSDKFDVEDGKYYRKVLTIKVPNELKDEVSNNVTLNIEIDGNDYKTTLDEIILSVQRPSYNADLVSVTMSENVEAGASLPIEIVLKNNGYNDLSDLFVTVKVPALNIEQKVYFGDLVSLETSSSDDDEYDTTSGKINLKIPYDAKPGIYAVEIKAENDDTTNSVVKQIIVNNELPENVIASSVKKTASAGENAEYTLLIVNPTDSLKVYRIVSESSSDVSSNADESVIAVPAGSSKTIKITAVAASEGEYNFDVNVLSGEELVSKVTLSLTAEGSSLTSSPIAVLTVILAVVFIVLLIVLIVLIGKKPNKSEEFGESYY